MGIYTKSLFETNFPASKPLKKRELTLNLGGTEFTVIIKPESSLKRSFGKTGYYQKCDMYEALANFLTRDEVIERDDPNLHVEAYHYRPEVGRDVPLLSNEDVEKRFQFVCNAYHILDNDKIVEAILQFAEKKKNGTLYKKRYTRIFSSGIVTRDFYTFSVFGYARSDTELEIYGDWVDFEKEIDRVDTDFLSQHLEVLSGEFNSMEEHEPGKKDITKTAEISFSAPGAGLDKVFTVTLREENGKQYLGNTPIDSFKCLKKAKKGYTLAISSSAFEGEVGKKYGEFEVSGYHYAFGHEFNRYFAVLEDYTFSPYDDEMRAYLRTLDTYLSDNGIEGVWDINDWPKEVNKYTGRYSLEESMEVLLKWIDEILSITPQEVQSFIADLPRTKQGTIKTNQNCLIRTGSFYLPSSPKKVDYKVVGRKTTKIKLESFSSIFYGGYPSLIIRTPMNHPNKNISFVFGVTSWKSDMKKL